MNIFMLGIGGAGMSSLAQYCQAKGFNISGCDTSESQVTKMLQEKGIAVHHGQSLDMIPEDTDLIVYTVYVESGDPSFFAQVKNLGIPMRTYFDYVGEITRQYRTIGVSGTHGKTTTVGLLTLGLHSAGIDANMIGGSYVRELGGSNFYAGESNWLVVEACEYKNHFRHITPEIVIVTNIEYEHVDYFTDFEMYKQAFKDFCMRSKVVIYHEGDEVVEEVLSDYEGLRIPMSSNTQERIELQIPGKYNRENASLALGVAQYMELDETRFRSGMQSFTGAARRQEYLGERDGVLIYDDYAHHPTGVSKTIAAFREKFPDKKIGLLFEPLLSREYFFDDFVKSFQLPDMTALYPIYIPGKQSDASLIKRFQKQDLSIQSVTNKEELEDFIQNLKEGDVLLCMGAGKMTTFIRNWLKG